MRRALLPGALLIALAPAVALAQDPAPGPAPPPAAELLGATVTRSDTRMTARVEYRLPVDLAATVPTAWRAFAGSRESRWLRPVAHGVRMVPVAAGAFRFVVTARMGAGTDRSGGFCVAPDFAAVGLPPAPAGCMDGRRQRRAALTARVPEAIVFGDSVGATFDWVPGTREAAARGLSVRYDLRACRRLIAAPCPPGPPSVLSSVRSLPGSLGDIAVIDVGYNDWAGTYDVPRVVRALRARGVQRIVWVTLRETQASYRQINAEIRLAARGSDRIQVADWNRASRGRAWFGADGVHPNTAGGWGMAAFLSREMRKAAAWLRDHPEAGA